MKVMAFDPGAERMGWAVISETPKNKPPKWSGSGYFGLKRERNEGKPEPYHEYRLRLLAFWIHKAPELFERYQPNIVVSEIVPVVGGGNFVAATQSQLAGDAITVVQVAALQASLDITQIGANTVKARIGGSKKATKVGVRNGVLKLMPQLENRKSQWVKMFDESDAIAIALTHLGYKNGR